MTQDELRVAYASTGEKAISSLDSYEGGAFLSLSKKLNSTLSVGITSKYLYQRIEYPHQILKRTYHFEDDSETTSLSIIPGVERKGYFDFDLSATWKFSPAFQAGFSVMNIAGTRLLSNEGEEEIRSFGLGLSYKIKRIHFGADIIATQDGGVDLSSGINIVPFSNAELTLGYGTAFDSYQLGFSYKIPFLWNSYIEPNYTYVNNDEFGGTHLLSIGFKF